MKRTIGLGLILAAICLLAPGCSSLKGSSTDALTAAVTAVAPEYAAAAEKVQKILAKQQEASSPVAGFAFQRVYRYKGAAVEAADISWEDTWTKIGSADKESIPVVTQTNTAASAATSDDAVAEELAKLLEGIAGDK
jgi:hypothetical protein